MTRLRRWFFDLLCALAFAGTFGFVIYLVAAGMR
jgi:hypothetical protein